MPSNSPWTRTIAGRPEPGSRAERSRTSTMCDVEIFTEMTGDKNPIHYDADLAAKSSFGGLIVQGGVTTGLLNAVVAEGPSPPLALVVEVRKPPSIVEMADDQVALQQFLTAARSIGVAATANHY